MAKLTRPKLATHYSGPRAGDRDCVSLEGRCAVDGHAVEAIAVLDLDARGCRLKGITVAVSKADVVRLWFGGVGPVEGRLRWAKRGSAGIAFAASLREDELLHAKRTAASAAKEVLIPLRRRIRPPG